MTQSETDKVVSRLFGVFFGFGVIKSAILSKGFLCYLHFLVNISTVFFKLPELLWSSAEPGPSPVTVVEHMLL